MAEHADHTRLVEPSAQHKEDGIDTRNYQSPGGKPIHNRPLASLLIPQIGVGIIEVLLQSVGCVLV